ncbi:hypothetical protein SE19_02420 [Acidiplasma aeolicum]|uniref:Uncharacterized protein n=1 Tax=Acidiplasma aeolicum TaxID=507754 RepID=A0A0P9DBG6_9ARCH|nr:ABC transporter permease subunit [Acidiplasma aeolicum]KPV47124.1 hypothetical protein SE19_02420 [Acidiplasma aeolicum]
MKSEFSHMKIFYKDYMHFASRSRIMLEMVIVDAAILAFIAYRISQISNLKALWPNGTAFSATFAGFAYFFVCWTATFMGSFAISNDFTTNSGQYILSLPVKRSSVFIGRYLAATTLAAMAVLSFFLFLAAESYFNFKTVPVTLIKGYFVSMLIILSAMSIIFLLSSLIRMDRFVLVGSFFLFFIAMPVIDGILQINSMNVNALLYVDANAVTKAIGSTKYFTYATFIQIVQENYNLLNFDQAMISMVIYAISMFIIGLYVYKHMEVK